MAPTPGSVTSRSVPSRSVRGPLVAVTAALLLLAGCGADDAADAGATTAPSGSSGGASSAAPDPDAPLTANQACAAMYVTGETTLEERIGSALVAASEGLDGTSADRMNALALELGRLESRVPEEFRGPVEQVRVPFLQLQEGLDLGTDQQVELDVAATVDGLKQYRELC